ncbi:MAG TPA: hypothetical protein VJ851_10605 [Jatrophihabitans sp.]|nr:hypothetical protein [Jatrophihabitans sp.]
MDDPDCPAVTDTDDGAALIEKSSTGTALTVSDTETVWVADAPVPVTTNEYVPAVALESTVRVMVELPPAVTELGLNDAVTPEGKPLTLNATVCGLPPVTAVLIVDEPDCPAVTDTADGAAPIEKSSATGLTVSDIELV